MDSYVLPDKRVPRNNSSSSHDHHIRSLRALVRGHFGRSCSAHFLEHHGKPSGAPPPPRPPPGTRLADLPEDAIIPIAADVLAPQLYFTHQPTAYPTPAKRIRSMLRQIQQWGDTYLTLLYMSDAANAALRNPWLRRELYRRWLASPRTATLDPTGPASNTLTMEEVKQHYDIPKDPSERRGFLGPQWYFRLLASVYVSEWHRWQVATAIRLRWLDQSYMQPILVRMYGAWGDPSDDLMERPVQARDLIQLYGEPLTEDELKKYRDYGIEHGLLAPGAKQMFDRRGSVFDVKNGKLPGVTDFVARTESRDWRRPPTRAQQQQATTGCGVWNLMCLFTSGRVSEQEQRRMRTWVERGMHAASASLGRADVLVIPVKAALYDQTANDGLYKNHWGGAMAVGRMHMDAQVMPWMTPKHLFFLPPEKLVIPGSNPTRDGYLWMVGTAMHHSPSLLGELHVMGNGAFLAAMETTTNTHVGYVRWIRRSPQWSDWDLEDQARYQAIFEDVRITLPRVLPLEVRQRAADVVLLFHSSLGNRDAHIWKTKVFSEEEDEVEGDPTIVDIRYARLRKGYDRWMDIEWVDKRFPKIYDYFQRRMALPGSGKLPPPLLMLSLDDLAAEPAQEEAEQ